MDNKLTGWKSNYYDLPPGATGIADLIEYRKMSFNVGNIFKAAYRLGDKKGTSRQYDLEKIIFFAQRELEIELGQAGWQEAVSKDRPSRSTPASDVFLGSPTFSSRS
jgi:hypothetical protein